MRVMNYRRNKLRSLYPRVLDASLRISYGFYDRCRRFVLECDLFDEELGESWVHGEMRLEK